MRGVILEAAKRSHLRFFTVILAVLVICTQLSVILNLSNRIYSQTTPKSNHSKLVQSKTILDVLRELPNPQVDEYEFKSKVVRPNQDMVANFAKHPSMIIEKLEKFVDGESHRTERLIEDIQGVRRNLRLKDQDDQEPKAQLGGRKLQSVEGTQECPTTSPYLLGPLVVKQSHVPAWDPGTEAFQKWYGNINPGGSFAPRECQPRQKVAIIIPYRDREEHLRLWLYHMHPILQRQQLDYQVFVVEQTSDESFNRAALMNIGYVEANKVGNFSCYVFHDVDIVPEDDRNIYSCPADRPKHLAVAVNKWKYRLIYDKYFGGITALNKEQFEKINGFANSFYGWGGEDDELYNRVSNAGYEIFRYPAHIARFSMLKHDPAVKGENVDRLMEKSKANKLKGDGLKTLRYKKLNQKNFPLYTWLLVKLPKAPPKVKKTLWDFGKESLISGLNLLGGSLAEQVSNAVDDMATTNEKNMAKGSSLVY
ncbi:beta-1,4-N-acetylgalactosaminyltransferase bre-4-like [Tigriopus californicus]|uniref:beta-1,4-N-acetylgalactosaminyltransferase bre-4-like n=1 Tax=Tigriopus californicus TaxID=6832 RepID=UPI0027D9E842|nr:beta-1,4-N-acetylgalactosaminyltransferase bre-4-like [Tigriopus californicus]